MAIPKVCEHCGVGYAAKKERNRFCSKACQYLSQVAPGNVPGTRRLRTCEQCRKEYKPDKPNALQRKGLQVSRFCSKSCHGKAKARQRFPNGPATQPCKRCGSPIPKQGSKRYCSFECRVSMQSARTPIEPKQPIEKYCRNCDERFIPTLLYKNFCSEQCWVKGKLRARGQPGNVKRRAEYFGVEFEQVDALSVFERDGWTCRLCGTATPYPLRGSTAPMAPELDHIIPISKGGPHTYANLQCACRRCNIAKGARTIAM